MSKAKYLAFYENWRMNKKWCTPEEWYELEDLILQLRFDGIDTKVEDIKNPKLQMIWNNIKPSLLKSNRDKRYNENKKSTLQEVKSTEFDTPKPEIENKADLSPSNDSDDKIYQPEVESGSNGLKMGKNEELKDNKEKDIEDMGNLLVFNQTTGRYEYPNKTKEEIKEKVIKNSLPTVQVAATAQTPSIPTFEEVLKYEKDAIENIIKDLNEGGMKARLQAPTRLSELFNRKWGRYYKEEITEYINNRKIA